MYFNTSINLIKVPNRFSHSRPNEDKMEACREFYRTNHRLERDIVVDENMYLKTDISDILSSLKTKPRLYVLSRQIQDRSRWFMECILVLIKNIAGRW
mgnify:CR=1 FL=1